jgi:hypothetical protein
MLLTHALLGALTENSHFRILGTTGKLCLESVVTLNPFLFTTQTQLLAQCSDTVWRDLYTVICQITMQALRTVGFSGCFDLFYLIASVI